MSHITLEAIFCHEIRWTLKELHASWELDYLGAVNTKTKYLASIRR